MKYLKLIRRNLFRNKLRASLTALLMAAIFFFVATLLGILYAFDRFTQTGEGYNRLVVQSAVSLATLIPYSYEQKLRQVPGVEDVCKVQWIGAYYKDQRNFFANLSIDHDHMLGVFPDYKADPKQFADFMADRRGAVVGDELMRRFGWKIGDKITLKGTIFPYDPDLTIRAVYHHPVNNSAFYYHQDFHNESVGNFSRVGNFWLKIKDPSQMAAISQQIDAMFKNSEYPTETFTEKEFQKQFLAMMGNIKLLFSAISLCAIFMVILLAAITMSMSARERVVEIAVLKAIGYPERLVLFLMLTEFTLLAFIGGALGVFGAQFVFHIVDMAKVTQGFLQDFHIHAETIAQCLGAAVAVGLIAGGWPALRSASMSVVDGLRRVV